MSAVNIRNLLVVAPNWVGDVVMATPVFAALRHHFGRARISFLMRSYVAEIVDGGGWHDATVLWPKAHGLRGALGLRHLAHRLAGERFDLALLLTNSLRSALVARLARIPRRVGYAREGRGGLLTDRLHPLKRDGEYIPSPLLEYYIALAGRIGCPIEDRRLRLGVSAAQEAAGAALKRHYGLDDGRPYAVLNPGAAFGAAKCWLPERFAEVCDRLYRERGLLPVLVGAAGEADLLRRIAALVNRPLVRCVDPGTSLGSLKVLIRDAKLLICNDTGPRHYGNAFGVPTVTIFGPTHQEWTDTVSPRERKLQASVECGPCQLRVCPLDHRCMRAITGAMVMASAAELSAAPC